MQRSLDDLTDTEILAVFCQAYTEELVSSSKHKKARRKRVVTQEKLLWWGGDPARISLEETKAAVKREIEASGGCSKFDS